MVIWSGPFKDLSGYATACRDYVLAMHRYGVDVRAHFRNYDHRGVDVSLLCDDYVNIEKIRITDAEIYDDIDNALKASFVCHATPNVSYRTNCVKNILYTVWETKYCPSEWKEFVKDYDLILTASEHSKECLSSIADPEQIKVLPHIIKEQKYSGESSLVESVREKVKDTKVYMWNSEWHIGKGYDIALKGFLNTFSGSKDVSLIFKTYSCSSTHYKNDVIDYIKTIKTHQYPKLIPVVGDISKDDLIGLYDISDVFISTSRREGFSLTASEAFAQGCILVAPDKGGHREFLNEDNSILYRSDFGPVNGLESGRMLYKGQEWVEPDVEALKYALRASFNVSCELKDDIRSDTLSKFGEENIVKSFMELVS